MEREKVISRKEFDEMVDGDHVPLACANHPEKRWSAKRVAITERDGGFRFNGARTIFYNLYNVEGMGEECDCSPSKLRVVIDGVLQP